jgi:hypothetical protein
MLQSVLLIFTAMVGIAGTLGGVWLGSYLERDNEALKWRRGHVLEAYSDFVRAVEVALTESDRMYVIEECKTEGHHKQAQTLFEKMVDMDRISQRVFLLAPRDVHEHMANLTDHMGKEVIKNSLLCPKIEKDERDATMKKSAELIVVFRNAARNDLGVHPPLHSREEWEKIIPQAWMVFP